MKHLLTLILLISFVLTGCDSDDSENTVPAVEITKDQLQGTWIGQGYGFDYFDANNKIVYTDVNDNDWVEKIEVDDATLTWVWTETGNAPSTVRYQLSTEQNKNYITLTGNDNKSDKLEISELSNTSMVWQLKRPSATYSDNGTIKTASYSITTITFSR